MVHVCIRSMVGLILTSMVGLQVWWLQSMVADTDENGGPASMVAPKYGGGRCWPAHGPRSVLGNRRAARNVAPGPWLLQFHTTEENKNFFCKCRWASRLGRQYSPVFFRSYRDLCKYIYLTIEYNSLKKNASVFPALCPNTQHLLVIRQKCLHKNQVVCEPTKFQSNTPNPPANPPCA